MTKPHTLIYPPNSDFDQKTKKIEGFLKALIESEGSHGLAEGTPASLYVCGAPGLGKTAAVRSCCEKLKSEFSRDDGTNLRKPLVCYINANNMQSSLDPELLVLERMADTLEMQNFRSPHITAIKGTMTRKKSQILIVIDELDMLLSEQEDAYSDAISKHEEALQTVAGWASDPDVPVGFVGIANRKGNAKFERLKQLGGVSFLCAKRLLAPNLYTSSNGLSLLLPAFSSRKSLISRLTARTTSRILWEN
jgi:Cdc6-like AAA superfamily ATPase